MMFALINFGLGLLVGAAPSILAIWKRGRLHRGIGALALALVPFGLGFALFTSVSWGPAKSIANIGEFIIYGVVSGTIPLGNSLGCR